MIAPLRVNLLLNNTQRRVNERDGLRTDGAHTRVLLYELVVYIHIYIHIMHNITTLGVRLVVWILEWYFYLE